MSGTEFAVDDQVLANDVRIKKNKDRLTLLNKIEMDRINLVSRKSLHTGIVFDDPKNIACESCVTF